MSTTILGDMLVRYRADISDLSNKISQAKSDMSTVDETAKKTGGSIFSGFTQGVKGAISFGAQIGQTVFGIQTLANSAIGLGQALLEPNASMEQTTVGFETLLRKGQKTQAFLKDLQDFAAATPFEFPELSQDAEHMLAFGFSAKEIIPDLTSIGDALSAMGKSNADIDAVVTVFGQMKAAGKVNAQDMMQLTSQGIPAWKILAQSMHLSVAEVQNLSQKGLLPADQSIKYLTAGMEKMFGGGMKAQATTFNGLLSTFQDNASAAMRAFTGPLFDAAKQGLTILGNLVSGSQFQSFATGAGKAMADVFSKIGSFLNANVIPAFQQLGPVIGQVGAYLQGDQFQGFIADVETVGNQIQNILVSAFQNLQPYLPTFKQAMSGIGEAMSGIVIALDNIVFPLGQFLLWMQQGSPLAQAVGVGLLAIAGGFAAIQIGAFIAAVPAIVAGFIAWSVAAWSAAIATIAATWPIFLIGVAVVAVVAIIILVVKNWGAISHWLVGAWKAAIGWLGGALNSIGQFFVGVWNWIKSATTAAWNFLVGIVKAGAHFLYLAIFGPFIAIGALFKWLYNHNTYFKQLIDSIVGIVKGGLAWLQNAFHVAFQWVVDKLTWFKDMNVAAFNMVYNAIRTALTAVYNFVQGIVSSVLGFFRARWNELVFTVTYLWQKISGIFSSAWSTYVSGPLNNLWNSILGFINGWPKQALQAGINFINMLVSGIKSGAGAIWDAVKGIASNIWSALGFHSPPPAGPAKDSDKWMPNFIKMLSSGLTSGAPQIKTASQYVAAQMVYPIKPSSSASVVYAGGGSTSSAGQGQTFILEVDGHRLAQIVNTSTDRTVRLKLGANGRAT
jgi:tape measure domain-containing protein